MLAILRAIVAAVSLCALSLSGGASGKFQGRDAPLPFAPAASMADDSIKSTSTFYLVRADLRKCRSPMCGGFFVKRVNEPSTLCLDGSMAPECYVAEIDWNGHTSGDAAQMLLRGDIAAGTHKTVGKFGVLRVTELWQSASDSQPTGIFYRVRDRGLRCIAAPCPTHHEAKLNSTVSRNIAGVDLTGAHAAEASMSEALAAMTGRDGVIVVGEHAPVRGPGGRSETLKATQFYLPTRSEEASGPCRKTGCSKQICSDQDVMSTCEWREEYAYQKATCERQRDGKCGLPRLQN